MPIKHNFVSALPDDPDTSLVRPSNWNDDHDMSTLTASELPAAGSDTWVQYNDGGSFGADVNFRWDKNEMTLFLGGEGETGTIRVPDGTVTSPNGDSLNLSGADGYDDGEGGASDGGTITIRSGFAQGTGAAGDVLIATPDAGEGGDFTPGDIEIRAGNGSSQDGGSITLRLGSGGNGGNLIATNVPTADPSVTDAIWNDNGTLVFSGSTAGGGSPGSPDTSIQFNSGGSFAGSSALLWDGGSFTMRMGDPESSGAVSIYSADGTAIAPNAVVFTFSGGEGYDDGLGGASSGGALDFSAGYSYGGSDGPAITITGGSSDGGTGGLVRIQGGQGDPEGHGGSVEIIGRDGVADTTPDQDGGNITLRLGAATGAGVPGSLLIENLPTADPSISDAVWADSGVLVLSGFTAGGFTQGQAIATTNGWALP